jgi:hypothetical protein
MSNELLSELHPEDLNSIIRSQMNKPTFAQTCKCCKRSPKEGLINGLCIPCHNRLKNTKYYSTYKKIEDVFLDTENKEYVIPQDSEWIEMTETEKALYERRNSGVIVG